MSSPGRELVSRSSLRLTPDPSRVITRLFVPGHEGFDHRDSRAGGVLARILDLDDAEVAAAYDDVRSRFSDRHRDFAATLISHAKALSGRLNTVEGLSPARELLLGAAFTSEYAIEGAALCNPSIVASPDQSETPPGGLRFVMSVRSIGEGHKSSIGFRTGMVDRAGTVTFDPASPYPTTGQLGPTLMDAAIFRSELHRRVQTNENADFVLDGLAEHFTVADLDERLGRLEAQRAIRTHTHRAVADIRAIAGRSYSVSFAPGVELSQRVLFPAVAAESNGMEDARFVRFTDDDGAVSYLASYTAYDGAAITEQLLQTTDFETFAAAPIFGAAAANKGLAFFPRRIRGRFAALSRSDRETNTITYSANLQEWNESLPCQVPQRSWEVLQLGNCGSPIETDAGWLVLTHGVGPMRTYSIGAILVDLDDPTRIIGQLREPLMSPATGEQDGYVPNVVYSCGALVHNGILVLPYGIGDCAIGLATAPVTDIIAALVPT